MGCSNSKNILKSNEQTIFNLTSEEPMLVQEFELRYKTLLEQRNTSDTKIQTKIKCEIYEQNREKEINKLKSQFSSENYPLT